MSNVTGSLGGARSARGGELVDPGLVLLYGEGYERLPPSIRFASDKTVIGREPPPGGVVLDTSAVSRVHARIERHGQQWILADLNSRNGVIVNGNLVTDIPLQPNDVVRIGDAIFKFVPERVGAYALYPVDGRGAQHSELVGGLVMNELLARITKIAETDLSVLVLGETGTGKELVARAVHARSGRRGRLCALNCAAIPANLVESELFGAKKGAFTGADRDRIGLVKTAHGGTLLLDEIGDMPLEAQAKLLRMLETKEIVPVGATEGEKVDVRVVCATHRRLQQLVDAGSFRGDLLARINNFTVVLPPLRERREDTFILVRHFLAKHGRPDAKLTLRFMVAALHYHWPYNVRELEAAVRRAIAVAEGGEIDSKHLPETLEQAMQTYGQRTEPALAQLQHTPVMPLGTAAPTAEQLRESLQRHAGNVAAVGREFGKDRQQIHRWMKAYGIDPEGFRGGGGGA
jgi:transcriptional regulator with GAF, ATPase, and Fis domain